MSVFRKPAPPFWTVVHLPTLEGRGGGSRGGRGVRPDGGRGGPLGGARGGRHRQPRWRRAAGAGRPGAEGQVPRRLGRGARPERQGARLHRRRRQREERKEGPPSTGRCASAATPRPSPPWWSCSWSGRERSTSTPQSRPTCPAWCAGRASTAPASPSASCCSTRAACPSTSPTSTPIRPTRGTRWAPTSSRTSWWTWH